MTDYTGGMTPLTAWDLREIAKVITKAERAFGDVHSGTETALSKPLDNIKLDVMRPGGGDDIVGHITYCDGWLGFVPLGPKGKS